MDDTITASGGTPKLNAALAKFQAQVPKITKDEQANVGTYRYSYADLTAISAEALPLLGKHGLAFSAWPTLLRYCSTSPIVRVKKFTAASSPWRRRPTA